MVRENILEQKSNKNFKIKEMAIVASKNKKIMYTFRKKEKKKKN